MSAAVDRRFGPRDWTPSPWPYPLEQPPSDEAKERAAEHDRALRDSFRALAQAIGFTAASARLKDAQGAVAKELKARGKLPPEWVA